MSKTIHMISGLPRSGSTLLCNILAQNPEMHSTPTSACHEALFVLRNAWGEWVEHKAAKSLANNLQPVLNATINAYHNTDRPVVIDIPQILSSFEKLHRKTQAKDQGNYFQAQTIQGRAEHLLGAEQVLGLAYNRLKDAMMRGLGDRLCLVEFDDLTHNPKGTLEDIYKFLELPNFEHDFTSVEQYTNEDDSVHGMDLHTIRKDVKPIKDDSVSVLGVDLCKQYNSTEFWRK